MRCVANQPNSESEHETDQGAGERDQRCGEAEELLLDRAHQVQRGEGTKSVVGGVPEREHAGLPHRQCEGKREQRGDHHLDRRIEQIGRQEQRQEGKHAQRGQQQNDRTRFDHWRSPIRPAGRTRRTSNMSMNGMLLAMVESCRVKSPPSS